MGYMFVFIQNIEMLMQKLWNLYDIFGIFELVIEKQIKSVYRKLFFKFYFDKIKFDVFKNEIMDDFNVCYVEIIKVYQVLIDEEVCNNYIQYGNFDGKQGYSINIVLLKVIVFDGNGKYVVFLYFVFFGILLLYLVGLWWYGMFRWFKEGVFMESVNWLFREYKDNIDEGGVIGVFSMGQEYDELFRGDKVDFGLFKVEFRIFVEGEFFFFVGGFFVKDKEKLEDFESGF